MNYQGLVWVGVYVEHLPSSVSFYRDVLGLAVLHQGEDWAHLDAGGGAMIELMSGGKKSPAPKLPRQQALVVGLRVPNLDQAYLELKSRGVVFTGEIGEYDHTRWAHFTDPEGNQLEIKELHSPG